jgi:hypothetical protein
MPRQVRAPQRGRAAAAAEYLNALDLAVKRPFAYTTATRGGDDVFDTDADRLTTYFRDGFSRAPTDGHWHIGFRCAADAR